MAELVIEKDIVQVLQPRRLTYFGHVNCVHTERYPITHMCFYMVIHIVTAPREDQGNKKPSCR